MKLLLRTTRRLTLSAAGEKFLERARDIIAELDDAEDAARGVDSLRGALRVALPVVFGTREVIPRLPEFLERNPLLRMELRVSDHYQDLVAEGVDVERRVLRLRLAGTTLGSNGGGRARRRGICVRTGARRWRAPVPTAGSTNRSRPGRW